MIYQLGTLDKWIRTAIHPDILLPSLSDTLLKECLDFAISEKERIGGYFRDKIIKGEPPYLTNKFIQAHQVGINTISDVIIGYTRTPKYALPPEVTAFYYNVCQITEDIISFIADHFPECFDEDIQITAMNAELSGASLGAQLQTLQTLNLRPSMDKALLPIVLRSFRELIEEGKRISYRELAYLEELASSLKGLLDMEESEDITYEMHLILLQMNFNHPRYVLHYSYWLDAQLAELPERTQRLDKLSWHLNTIEQVRFKPGYIFIPGLPSLTEQLLSSVKTTYQYLLTHRNIHHTVVEQINHTSKPTHIKIRLSVSVAVLALFLKILIKAGIILNENKAEVFRGIADNFTTLKSGNISYDSLRGKYNKTPPATYLQLKNMLAKMLELLRQV